MIILKIIRRLICALCALVLFNACDTTSEDCDYHTLMKKSLLFMIAVVCCMAASAAAPERKMLEQGKMWVYVYHHFEENETGYDESVWESYYQLDGDIIIDGQQYMKM